MFIGVAQLFVQLVQNWLDGGHFLVDPRLPVGLDVPSLNDEGRVLVAVLHGGQVQSLGVVQFHVPIGLHGEGLVRRVLLMVNMYLLYLIPDFLLIGGVLEHEIVREHHHVYIYGHQRVLIPEVLVGTQVGIELALLVEVPVNALYTAAYLKLALVGTGIVQHGEDTVKLRVVDMG